MEQRNFSAEKTAATGTAATMQLHQGFRGLFLLLREREQASSRSSLSLSLFYSGHCTAPAPASRRLLLAGIIITSVAMASLALFSFSSRISVPGQKLAFVSSPHPAGGSQPERGGVAAQARLVAMQPHCVAFACIAYIVLLYLGVSIGSGAREMRCGASRAGHGLMGHFRGAG